MNRDKNLHVGMVSIVMPTYNVENIVSKTIESVLEQSYPDWELIIIDDSSSDNTVSILNQYSNLDNRIRVLKNSVNSGAGISRNNGIKESNGQYLAFLDSDDLWAKDKLSKQVQFMKLTCAEICHTSFSFIDENGVDRKGGVIASPYVNLEDNLRKTEIGTSTAMINRNLVTDLISFSSIRARQDLKLWIDLLSKGYTSRGLNQDLVKYRIRKKSISSNKIKMLLVTFYVYMGVGVMPVHKRLLCYFSYVLNAIAKRNN